MKGRERCHLCRCRCMRKTHQDDGGKEHDAYNRGYAHPDTLSQREYEATPRISPCEVAHLGRWIQVGDLNPGIVVYVVVRIRGVQHAPSRGDRSEERRVGKEGGWGVCEDSGT